MIVTFKLLLLQRAFKSCIRGDASVINIITVTGKLSQIVMTKKNLSLKYM